MLLKRDEMCADGSAASEANSESPITRTQSSGSGDNDIKHTLHIVQSTVSYGCQ